MVRRSAVCVVLTFPADAPHAAETIAALRAQLQPADLLRHVGPLAGKLPSDLKRHHLVLVNVPLLPSPGWLDALGVALDAPDVGLVGPRSSGTATSQLFIPWSMDLPTLHREIAHRATVGAGRLREVPLLHADVVAGRAEVLANPATWAADGSASAPSGRTVVAEGAVQYRWEPGYLTVPADAPLLSVCLTVKNETMYVRRCLEALQGTADEVIVYDTGSTDDTTAIATELGARVIHGFWDDDFAAARNRTLDHARGRYIAWIDADERLDGGAALREVLLAEEPLVLGMPWRDVRGDMAIGAEAVSTKVFSRGRHGFTGRLHEVVLDVFTGNIEHALLVDCCAILHVGNIGRATTKDDRNVRISREALEEAAPFAAGDELAKLELNYARSLRLHGDTELALELAAASTARLTVGSKLARWAAHAAAGAAVESAAPISVVQGAIDELARQAPGSPWVPMYQAAFALREAEYEQALTACSLVVAGDLDTGDLPVNRDDVSDVEARALAGLGRWREAATVLESAAARGTLKIDLGEADTLLHAGGSSLARLAARADDTILNRLTHDCASLPLNTAMELLEALAERRPGDPKVVLEGCRRACQEAGPMEALRWTERAVGAGLNYRPLLEMGQHGHRALEERLLCVGLAFELDPADDTAATVMAQVAAELSATDLAAVIDVLTDIIPMAAARLQELDVPLAV